MDPHLAQINLALREAERDLPRPTTLLDTGMSAHVYNTEDPNVVVRVAIKEQQLNACYESELLEPDFAAGVVEVYALVELPHAVVTWKERLDVWVEGYVLRQLPPNKANAILSALVGIYDLSPQKLRVLKTWRGTRGLAQALEAGLPNRDLDLHSNLGVTSDGRIVAFDL